MPNRNLLVYCDCQSNVTNRVTGADGVVRGTPTAPAFFINTRRKSALHLEGRSKTRFKGWSVTLRSVERPYRNATGKLVRGHGSLRCPRGQVLRMPLYEVPTEDNAAILAATVAHVLDVPT